MNSLEIHCVTDKDLPYLKNLPCKLAGVGKSNFSKEYNLAVSATKSGGVHPPYKLLSAQHQMQSFENPATL